MGKKFINGKRFHVTLGDRRTTVSVDKTLSTLLALHLGTIPDSPEAHGAVRAWLQARLDEESDPGRIGASHWLQGRVVEALVDKELSRKYGEWILSDRSESR